MCVKEEPFVANFVTSSITVIEVAVEVK